MQTMCQPCNTAKGNNCHASTYKSCLGYRGRIKRLRKKIQKEMTANKRRRKGHYLSGTSDGGFSFMVFKKRYKQLQQRFLRLKVIADARKAMKEKMTKDYDEEAYNKAHALANAYEEAGNPILAGILRVEAANIIERGNDWKPIHKPSIGPYGEDNPCVCVNCGRSSYDTMHIDWGEEKVCDQSRCSQV